MPPSSLTNTDNSMSSLAKTSQVLTVFSWHVRIDDAANKEPWDSQAVADLFHEDTCRTQGGTSDVLSWMMSAVAPALREERL